MASIIKLKRGNKINLPVLKNAELGYTLDTKELFVGNGTSNYNLSSIENNLILNSNFTIPANKDNDKATITAGNNQYLMGNYYITCANQVNVTKTYDGFVRFSSTGTFSFDYIERLVTSDGLPFNNQVLTLSFDIINYGIIPITITSGSGTNTQNLVIPVGQSRQSFNFTMTYPLANQYVITLFSIKTSQEFDIKIGNIRLDKGYINNNYTSILPMFLESPALDMTFRTCSGKFRVVKTTLNTLTFIIPCYLNKYIKKISSITIRNLSNVEIYNNLGIAQTGFTTSISLNTDNCISLVATKPAHLLTDATLFLKFDVSLK